MIHKPTVPEVLPIVRALYARHSAGCCWHVVLDDGNVGREMVVHTARDAVERGCAFPECTQLANLLPRMSPTQIRKLASSASKRPE